MHVNDPASKASFAHYTDTLFQGGGQMGELMRAFNWEKHPLGHPQQWPHSLQNLIRLLLNSHYPMFIWWSRDLYMFHNDPYLPALGKKHPQALGAKASQMWSEIWWQIGDIVERILSGGAPFYAEDLLIQLERKGFMEETYWTFSYNPAFTDWATVGGIFCVCHETTPSVLSKRRLNTLKSLAEVAPLSQTLEQVSHFSCQALDQNREDIPFGLIYLLEENNKKARLTGQTSSLPAEALPPLLDLTIAQEQVSESIKEVMQSKNKQVITYHLPSGKSPLSANSFQIAILPLVKPGSDMVIGFFMAAISGQLEYNTDYENFQELVAGHIATALTHVYNQKETDRQREQLHSLFLQAPAPIVILNGEELVFELVNPAYQQIFPGRTLLGKPLLEALPEVRDTPIASILQQVYQTGETFVAQEMPLMLARHQDGPLEEIYWTFIYQARRNRQGEVNGVLAFAHEVTNQVLARRQLEESARQVVQSNQQLALANEHLQRINNDLDNFVYTASHDLKAPILNIEGLLKALERQIGKESLQKDAVGQIYQLLNSSVNRFKTTIRDLTEVARISKESSEDVISIDLSQVLEEVLQDLAPQRQESGAHLTIELDCPSLFFSRKNLKSILYNLLSNAFKYHSPERELQVHIKCRIQGDYYELTVGDNGMGMDMRQEEKIFALFKRLHAHVEGTGIGLYIVKKIIENAGGRIVVESQVGVGSTFKVYLKQ
ncbi:PAS domain-containing protein [Rhodocytophaga rosea]|uniref:histidine kinase n=1 Tax=Rhodocytophaga rosea TaxID=2704465 RepID=A0A6C0GHW5_9BACT|nr:PAS domain-containing sensor histidine kinase [Rhodocytophaga rosea]QHT67293.1 PAS domain-containing protein [Rhodocytophaga rosea]